ncbi:MAG: hypothetical protein ACRCUT_06110, partial [Spirochaetota bacterium]
MRKYGIAALVFLVFSLPLVSCKKNLPAEKEPNDSYADATAYEVGTPVSGTISSPLDRDFYSLDIAQGAPFNITLSAVKGVNHALRIWRTGGAEPLLLKYIDDTRKSSPEGICNMYLSSGRYYIEI